MLPANHGMVGDLNPKATESKTTDREPDTTLVKTYRLHHEHDHPTIGSHLN